MKVLIACEESQRVCIEFRKKGHEAFSCDIQECSGGHPEWHINNDVIPIINGYMFFFTQDLKKHYIDRWDLIIAHPPCTYLTPAGACNIPKDITRIAKGFEAKKFFEFILNADCNRICVENPPPMTRFNLPKYSQLIHPWYFGDPFRKPTALWLKGLPLLFPTDVVTFDEEMYTWYSHSKGKIMTLSKWYQEANKNGQSSKNRSKTFPGIAKAMAEQWG